MATFYLLRNLGPHDNADRVLGQRLSKTPELANCGIHISPDPQAELLQFGHKTKLVRCPAAITEHPKMRDAVLRLVAKGPCELERLGPLEELRVPAIACFLFLNQAARMYWGDAFVVTAGEVMINLMCLGQACIGREKILLEDVAPIIRRRLYHPLQGWEINELGDRRIIA